MVTPNRITKLRFLLTLVGIVILVIWPSFFARMVAFWILFIAGLSDFLDGWLARRWGLITDTGKILDPIADKFFILGVMGVFSYLKLYSFYWVLLIAIREIGVTLIEFHYLKSGKVIAAENMGKLKTILQTISLLVSYFYLFARDHFSFWKFWPAYLTDLLRISNHLLLYIAVFLTLISGLSFLLRLKGSRS